MHAADIWNLGGSEDVPLGGFGYETPAALADMPEGPKKEKQLAIMSEQRDKIVRRGNTVAAPCDQRTADVHLLGRLLFMAAIWRLEQDGVVGLSFGEPVARGKGGSVTVRWTELPIDVMLERRPRRPPASLEGRVVEALAEQGGSGGTTAIELGRAVAEREPFRAILIARDAAVDQGLLAPCEQGDEGATAIGFRRIPREGLGRIFGRKSVPHYFRPDCTKRKKLSAQFSKQNDAFRDYRKKHEGFEDAIHNDWSPLPFEGEGTAGTA